MQTLRLSCVHITSFFYHEVSQLLSWVTQKLVRFCHILRVSIRYCRNRQLQGSGSDLSPFLQHTFLQSAVRESRRYKRSEQDYSALIGKTTSHERSLNHLHREDHSIQCLAELQRTKKPVIHEWNCRQVSRVHVATLSLRWSHSHKKTSLLVVFDYKRGFPSDCRGQQRWTYTLKRLEQASLDSLGLVAYLFFQNLVCTACIVLLFPFLSVLLLWQDQVFSFIALTKASNLNWLTGV